MARKKDSPQKAALREMMSAYLKENNVKVKDGTDVNSIMRDMVLESEEEDYQLVGVYLKNGKYSIIDGSMKGVPRG